MNSIYVRTSTSKQDLSSQITLCKAAAGENATIYEDAAISGKRDDRSGIDRLLQDARAGKVTAVYITELSRIGRSLGFTVRIVEELHQLGVKVILAKTGTILDPSSLEGKAMLGALALAADIEHALLMERNERGRVRMQEKGSKPGRKPKAISNEAIRALALGGKSASHIATELGVSKATISRRLKSLGIMHQKGGYCTQNRNGPQSPNNEPTGGRA